MKLPVLAKGVFTVMAGNVHADSTAPTQEKKQ
jgi:hypothetical protein